MWVIIPIAWPFLVLYLMVRFWKVTLPLAVIGFMYWLTNAYPVVGWSVIVLAVVIGLWMAHLHEPSGIPERERV